MSSVMRDVPLPPTRRAWPLVIAALVGLNVSLTFANVWPTPLIQWAAAASIDLAAVVLVLALLGARARRLVPVVLPTLWLVLVVGRYLDVTAPALYGRAFNLYWDSPHLLNVAAMLTDTVPLATLAAAALGVVLLVTIAFVAARVALGVVCGAACRPRMRPVLAGLALAVLAGFAADRAAADPDSAPRVFAAPVTASYVRQMRSVLATLGPGLTAPSLPASPDALAAAITGLDAADVQLIFVESYGAVTYDAPDLAAGLAPARAALALAAADTGRQVLSAFVESPTFGGGSWLAHLSLITGIDVRDQYRYQSLMTESRPTLVTAFARSGYRTVALMPGMRKAWPEGAFYRYDTIYGRDALGYRGPAFGWWSIPDQFTLAQLDALEGARPARPPLFVVFPTSTTHAPFGPVAPYQPSWPKVLAADAYDPDEVARILGRPPALTNLSADYLHAMQYEFTVFAGYLRARAADPLVMVLVGDHQPPAAVSGRAAPWTVPVHVITSDAAVIESLRQHGFRPGTTPVRPSLGGLHALAPMLMHAFNNVVGVN